MSFDQRTLPEAFPAPSEAPEGFSRPLPGLSGDSSTHDGDSHLRPVAYYVLAVLAVLIGLWASAVTIQLFAEAIRVTEPEGHARELLTLTAALFVVAELAACFMAGLIPVRRLRALRWKLIGCAVLLVAFEAVSLYGARVALLHAAEAQASASQGRAEALRARIEASRRNAAALLAAGEVSSRSVLASSRAEGARSIRDAAAMESETERLAAELAKVEAARAPTAATVFGQSGAVAMAVAQSLLISSIGLLFLGAAGALARAARDARASTAATPARTDATAAPTDACTDAAPAVTDARAYAATTRTDAATDARSRTDALADAMVAATAARIHAPTDASRPQPVAAPQIQATPKGIPPAVPTWGRYAALAAGAGAGLLVPYAAQAAAVQAQAADAAPTQAEAPVTVIHAAPAPTDAMPACTDALTDAATPMQPHADAAANACTDAVAVPTDARTDATPRTDAPTDAAPAPTIHAAAVEPIQLDAFPEALILTATDAASSVTRNDDGARFLRVKAGIEAGRIKPTLRAIYAAEGASQEVARRYLVELEQAGTLERSGRGYALRAGASTRKESQA